MPTLPLLSTVAREFFSSRQAQRETEPLLVMDDPDSVAAYVKAGREDAVMASVYLYHCANICEVIRPGDTVVDLACGPANMLTMVARLNPQTRFIGVDLSAPMLEQARELVASKGLTNVEFRTGDITDLSMFADKSVDAVMSTMALHHLPTVDMLCQTFAEVARILKEDGGVYMADFGHLKLDSSIDYFGNQHAHRQPQLFTIDYINSLKAAFFLEDFERAVRPLSGRATLYSTIVLPFMVALKSQPRRARVPELADSLAKVRTNLTDWQMQDYKDLRRHFKLKGLSSAMLP